MVEHTQTTTNCLSVFDHFVRLALKGLRWVLIRKFRSHLNIVDGAFCKYRWRLKAVCHFRKNTHRRYLYLQQTPTFPTQLSLRFRDGQYIWKSCTHLIFSQKHIAAWKHCVRYFSENMKHRLTKTWRPKLGISVPLRRPDWYRYVCSTIALKKNHKGKFSMYISPSKYWAMLQH